MKTKQMKPYLLDKRREYIWSLVKQGYSVPDVASIFGITRGRAHTIIKNIPADYVSPWVKRKDI